MVNIYTNKNMLDIPVLEGSGAKGYFVFKVGGSGVSAEGISCMKEVDGAEFVEGSRDTIRTPFGVTSVNNLSTGCLTLLNILHIRDKGLPFGVDVTGCGINALKLAFAAVDDTNIPLVLRYITIGKCGNRDYLLNGKYRVDDVFDLISMMQTEMEADENEVR